MKWYLQEKDPHREFLTRPNQTKTREEHTKQLQQLKSKTATGDSTKKGDRGPDPFSLSLIKSVTSGQNSSKVAKAVYYGHGIELKEEMSSVQFPRADTPEDNAKLTSDVHIDEPSEVHISEKKITKILNIKLAYRDPDKTWDISLKNDTVTSIDPHTSRSHAPIANPEILNGDKGFLLPSLCHPHIHLDKCFLLSDPKYSDLFIQKGDFAEALSLTSQAKARFTPNDLLRRGRWLVKESVAAGVTCMRAFVEIDATVGFKCLEAGLTLKEQYRDACHIQICAFAQDPIFSGESAAENSNLMEQAVQREGVDVIGSTPYVEADEARMRQNIHWAIVIAMKYEKHLDMHLDYNLDASREPITYYVIDVLQKMDWKRKARDKKIVLGHCTRLTLFTSDQWYDLKRRMGDLPISFVGLPTSDLFMMGRPTEDNSGGERPRGTLQIPQMINEFHLQGTFGVNNVGNAFTPQGCCDSLSLASMCVGVYQAGSKRDAETLYEYVSTRAKLAIGYGDQCALDVKEGDKGDLVLVSASAYNGGRLWDTLQDVINDPPRDRSILRWSHIVRISTGKCTRIDET
ncbi:MAG: hypothetical protein Q9209_000764 [Squamulea sp. 1 TL-2023]